MDIAVIYINLYLLFPRFLKKRKLAEYLAFTAFSILCLILGEYLVELYYWKEDDIEFGFYVHVFVQTSVTLSAAVAVKILKEVLKENQLREEAEKQKLTFELKNLKKQINPHFLFNVLNGIYIQSKIDHKAVPETIMQFSDLLRYQIYDAEKNEKVLLTREIEFIKNYIALEQIRRDNTEVITNFNIEDQSFRIEPLIFLSLVENAFKYSIPTSTSKAVIELKLNQKGDKLKFQISNSIGTISHNGKEESSGFGLSNLRKRLALLYPDRHNMEVDNSEDGRFNVRLEITQN